MLRFEELSYIFLIKYIIKMNFKSSLKVLLSLLLVLMVSCQHFQDETAPTGLMTDLLLHPEEAVITNPSPRFS